MGVIVQSDFVVRVTTSTSLNSGVRPVKEGQVVKIKRSNRNSEDRKLLLGVLRSQLTRPCAGARALVREKIVCYFAGGVALLVGPARILIPRGTGRVIYVRQQPVGKESVCVSQTTCYHRASRPTHELSSQEHTNANHTSSDTDLAPLPRDGRGNPCCDRMDQRRTIFVGRARPAAQIR